MSSEDLLQYVEPTCGLTESSLREKETSLAFFPLIFEDVQVERIEINLIYADG